MEYIGCIAYPVGDKHEPFWILRKTSSEEPDGLDRQLFDKWEHSLTTDAPASVKVEYCYSENTETAVQEEA